MDLSSSNSFSVSSFDIERYLTNLQIEFILVFKIVLFVKLTAGVIPPRHQLAENYFNCSSDRNLKFYTFHLISIPDTIGRT